MPVNKVILIGNVGKDPDVKYFDQGSARASFSLATTERGYTLANGTQVPDRTEWHNIVCSRGLAQIAEKYVRKGMPLYIEGKIRSRSYEDQSGIKRYVYEIFADNMELLGRKGDNDNSDYKEKQSSSNYPNKSSFDSPRNSPSSPSSSHSDFNNEDDEDDLPF